MPLPDRIRAELPEDYPAVDRLLRAAFATGAEADLVKELRAQVEPLISLVAVHGREVVGHVMLSPVTGEGFAAEAGGMGLGPLAVATTHQGRGVGGELVRCGLNVCRESGYGLAFVLGHPEYYRRFGFQAAVDHGLHYRSAELDPWFMVAELSPGSVAGAHGLVRYHRLFDLL